MYRIDFAVEMMRKNGYSTNSMIERLQSSLADTERFLDKENTYNPEFRTSETQSTIDYYKEHREALKNAIESLKKVITDK